VENFSVVQQAIPISKARRTKSASIRGFLATVASSDARHDGVAANTGHLARSETESRRQK
jgi:hypothetical protein